jgi:hypothetical protein
MWNQHTTDLQRDAGLELVRIPAKANAGCASDIGVVQWKLTSGAEAPVLTIALSTTGC